ncbi:MAG TPA: flagellar FlbD family protein [Glaciihabitans sp.]|nr:flagellar FlbD family protein [Glaciihabitans sp.]
MIVVTRLNGTHFAVNPDLIERIHENPDTTLVLVDGSTYIVTEPLTAVTDLIVQYRARVIALAYSTTTSQTALRPHGDN